MTGKFLSVLKPFRTNLYWDRQDLLLIVTVFGNYCDLASWLPQHRNSFSFQFLSSTSNLNMSPSAPNVVAVGHLVHPCPQWEVWKDPKQRCPNFCVSGPYWKKSCLGPHIKYTNTSENWWATRKVVSKPMILCWAALIATLGRMGTVGHRSDAPARSLWYWFFWRLLESSCLDLVWGKGGGIETTFGWIEPLPECT